MSRCRTGETDDQLVRQDAASEKQGPKRERSRWVRGASTTEENTGTGNALSSGELEGASLPRRDFFKRQSLLVNVYDGELKIT